jgi:hypothetical protein
MVHRRARTALLATDAETTETDKTSFVFMATTKSDGEVSSSVSSSVVEPTHDGGHDRSAAVDVGRTASFYELVQCVVNDECPVEDLEGAQIWVFLFNTMYDVLNANAKLIPAVKDTLVRACIRFVVTYGVHCAMHATNKMIVTHFLH